MSRKDWTKEQLFYRLKNNKSQTSYWDNIGELRKRTDRDIFDTCVELTKSQRPTYRRIGINVLAQLGTPMRPFRKQSVDIFFSLLRKEKNTAAISDTLYAIGHNNEKLTAAQTAALAPFATHRQKEIREAVGFALLGVDRPMAIDCLILLSQDKVAYTRDWATMGLGTFTSRDNKKIREALWNRVFDNDMNTKSEAIIGLVKRKDEKIRAIMVDILERGEFGTLFLEAVEELGDKSFLPMLRKTLKKAASENNVSPDWLTALKNCINSLKKLKD